MPSSTDQRARLSALSEAYRATFLHTQSPQLLEPARAVLEDLRRVGHVDRQTVRLDREGRVDPLAMAFNEGKRFMFLRIQQCLALDPAKLARMIDQVVGDE